AELLPPPPGMASLRGNFDEELSVGDFNLSVRFAEQPENARQVRQPLFYRMIAGANWAPPRDIITGDTADARASELADIKRQIAELRGGSAGDPETLSVLQ